MINTEYKQRRPFDDLTALDNYTAGDLVRYLRSVANSTGDALLHLRLDVDGALDVGRETRDGGWVAVEVKDTAEALAAFVSAYRTDWERLYRSCFLQAENYDVNWVDTEGWAALDDERRSAGGEFPRAISEMRVYQKGGANAWEAFGIRKLLGESVEKLCAMDHIETVLPLLDGRMDVTHQHAFRMLMRSIRSNVHYEVGGSTRMAAAVEQCNELLQGVEFDAVSRPIHEALYRCVGSGNTGVSLGFVCGQLRAAIKAAEAEGVDVSAVADHPWFDDIIHHYLSWRA